MLRSVATAFAFVLCLPLHAHAQETASPEELALFEAVGLSEMIEIISEEGITDARQLSDTFFPNQTQDDMVRAAVRVYDVDAMREQVLSGWAGALSQQDISALRVFYDSDLGTELVMREVSARRAMMDAEVERAAYDAADRMRAEALPRLAQLDRMIEVYDLTNGNVAGALNANYAFFRGLADGGGMPNGFDEGMVLADVWSQEPEVRAETERWLYAYLGLSYSGLSDADMDRYIAFCETDAAQALNTVIFATFGALFENLSREMAFAVGQRMRAEDI